MPLAAAGAVHFKSVMPVDPVPALIVQGDPPTVTVQDTARLVPAKVRRFVAKRPELGVMVVTVGAPSC